MRLLKRNKRIKNDDNNKNNKENTKNEKRVQNGIRAMLFYWAE